MLYYHFDPVDWFRFGRFVSYNCSFMHWLEQLGFVLARLDFGFGSFPDPI